MAAVAGTDKAAVPGGPCGRPAVLAVVLSTADASAGHLAVGQVPPSQSRIVPVSCCPQGGGSFVVRQRVESSGSLDLVPRATVTSRAWTCSFLTDVTGGRPRPEADQLGAAPHSTHCSATRQLQSPCSGCITLQWTTRGHLKNDLKNRVVALRYFGYTRCSSEVKRTLVRISLHDDLSRSKSSNTKRF